MTAQRDPLKATSDLGTARERPASLQVWREQGPNRGIPNLQTPRNEPGPGGLGPDASRQPANAFMTLQGLCTLKFCLTEG
jgi:hypothetical protein